VLARYRPRGVVGDDQVSQALGRAGAERRAIVPALGYPDVLLVPDQVRLAPVPPELLQRRPQFAIHPASLAR